MTKIFSAVFAICFLLLVSINVSADVLTESTNDFHYQHQNECVYLERTFVTNGENDTVSMKIDPTSNKEIAILKKEEEVFVRYTCLYKGNYWGLAEFQTKKGTWKFGWVRMDALLVKYDFVSFQEEHLKELHPYRGDYAAVKEAGAAVAWPWPEHRISTEHIGVLHRPDMSFNLPVGFQ